MKNPLDRLATRAAELSRTCVKALHTIHQNTFLSSDPLNPDKIDKIKSAYEQFQKAYEKLQQAQHILCAGENFKDGPVRITDERVSRSSAGCSLSEQISTGQKKTTPFYVWNNTDELGGVECEWDDLNA